MRDETAIDMQEAEEMHEAMDYAQHEGTWASFTNMVKWGIIEIVFVVLALYCFLVAGAPAAGGVLLLIGILAIPGSILFGRRA